MIDIKKYERNAKLDLSEKERLWITERAEYLINSFRALDSIDTAGIEPLVTVLDIRNILRDDTASKLFSREELLSGAPEQFNGFFRLPKALD